MPLPRLYTELASWWPLVSHPSEYEGEAAFVRHAFERALGAPPPTLLELGSGGGSLASHLRGWTRLSLSDRSAQMLEVSRGINPRCEHIEGDMRSIRLGRVFEAVLLHDAVAYMTTLDDLVAALSTARAHVAPSGAVLVLPDHVAESFAPAEEVGGRDADDGSGRGVRFLEWEHAPIGGSCSQAVDYALVLREADGSVRVVHDRHVCGLFSRPAWHEAFGRAGFSAVERFADPWREDVFLARP